VEGEERCERRKGWREDSVCGRREERVCERNGREGVREELKERRVCGVEGEEKEEMVVIWSGIDGES
jgi:hypothetical protein